MFRPMHRYNNLPPTSRRFARVPRYARLLSLLDVSSPELIRTEAQLFWFAYSYKGETPKSHTGIIDDALRTSKTRWLGWHNRRPEHMEADDLFENPIYREWQIRLAMAMLGAIAFEMMFGRGANVPSNALRHALKFQGSEPLKALLKVRVIGVGGYVDVNNDPIPSVNIYDDWKRLVEMDSVGLSHFIFASSGLSTASETELRFSDITTQAFFAAYWVCNYGSKANDFTKVWHCVPDDATGKNEAYTEFWRFVAEIPESALVPSANDDSGRLRWCELLYPIFDPRREKSLCDARGNLIRSNELICRSWMSMTAIRKNAPKSWEDFSKIRSTEFQSILQSGLGSKKQSTAKGLLFTEEGKDSFIGLCEGEHRNDNGVFQMGSDHLGQYFSSIYADECPVHEVHLSHYRLHRYVVSNTEYELYDNRNRSRREFKDKVAKLDHHPVVRLRWWDSLSFALWIGELTIGHRHYEIVLPTEAQFEYAFRAGSNKPFPIEGMDGEELREYCPRTIDFGLGMPLESGSYENEEGEYLEHTIPVNGRFESGRVVGRNAWGFSQLHGNVWEWLQDWYGENYYSQCAALRECLNPAGPDTGRFRVIRGRSRNSRTWEWRASPRRSFRPANHDPYLGFRLAAVPIEPRENDVGL